MFSYVVIVYVMLFSIVMLFYLVCFIYAVLSLFVFFCCVGAQPNFLKVVTKI